MPCVPFSVHAKMQMPSNQCLKCKFYHLRNVIIITTPCIMHTGNGTRGIASSWLCIYENIVLLSHAICIPCTENDTRSMNVASPTKRLAESILKH